MKVTSVLPAEDIEHVLTNTQAIWHRLQGARLFVTGATGWYGKWVLASIAAANDALHAGVTALLLSRDPASFSRSMPHLASRPEFKWLQGEPAGVDFPPANIDYVIHLASPAAAELCAGDTVRAMETLLGMQRVLEFARRTGARRLLLASSGAVYGAQPTDLSHIPEDHRGAPDPLQPLSAYGEIKRMSELLSSLASGVECVSARGFSCVGPYMPLTDKFAVGSFIRDGLAGGPIRIIGDGTPQRSYLHTADMAIWLMTLLVSGRANHAYNVGSDVAISLGELASRIARHTGNPAMTFGAPPSGGPPSRYVPSIRKAREELGLEPKITLDDALRRTVAWAKGNR